MDPKVHRGRNGAAGENRVRKLGSVLTLDIFQKGQATRRISIVRTDPFSSSCDIAKLPRSTEKSLCDIAKPSRSTGKCPRDIGKPLRHVGEALSRLFGPGRAQLRCDVFVLRVRQLPSRRGRSRRFPTKRRYDVKMRMVNGLAAAESVI